MNTYCWKLLDVLSGKLAKRNISRTDSFFVFVHFLKYLILFKPIYLQPRIYKQIGKIHKLGWRGDYEYFK